MEQNNFKKDVVNGLSWTFLNQIVSQVIFLVLSIILARLVLPKDFGILAMINIFTNFASIFIDFGFSSAIIQKKNISHSILSTVFWFNVLIGTILTLSFFLCSGLIADFYDNDILRDVTKVLSFTFIISSLTSIQITILVKELKFKRQTIIGWSATLVSSLTAITLAYKGYGVWSLVAQTLLNSILTSIFYWYQSNWRPSFVFSYNEFKSLLGFGGSVAGTSIFNYWTRNADNLMVGKMIGEGALGIYNRAYSLMLLPVTNITGSVTKVMFPALSSIQNDLPRIKLIYLKLSRIIAFISFPLMFGLCAVAEPFVLFAYGEKWIDVIPILQILSLLGAFQSISSLNGVLYNSQGRADLAFKTTLFFNVLLVMAFYLGLKLNGLIGLAWAYFIIAGVGSIPILFIAIKLINVSLLEQIKNLFKIFIASAIMLILLFLLNKSNLVKEFSYFMQLILLISTGATVYSVLIVIFKERIYQEYIEARILNFKTNFMKKISNKFVKY